MSDVTARQRGKKPWLLLFLLLLASGGFILLAGMDKPPAFLDFLLPSSSLPQDPPARALSPPELPALPAERSERPAPPTLGAPVMPLPQAISPPEVKMPESGQVDAPPAESPAAHEAGARPPASAEDAKEDAPEEAPPTALPEESAAPLEAPQAAPEAAPPPESAPPPEAAPAAPVLIYGKGRPVNERGSVVRGSIPADQDRAHEAARAARLPRSRYLPGGQDSIVTAALVDDLARFLADNYWPAGTHPQAGRRGISTAGVKWANMRYGAGLVGFSADRAHPDKARARILEYLFMPSMIRNLYGLYEERFFQALESEALNRAAGPQGAFFTNAQLADMFEAYAAKAQGLSLALTGYRDTPGIGAVVRDYAEACAGADSAYRAFLESREALDADREGAESRYRDALRKRESRGRALAGLMRSGPRPGVLDDDSLTYTALWLYRRGEGKEAALTALADICAASAKRLTDLGSRYKGLPPGQIARPGL